MSFFSRSSGKRHYGDNHRGSNYYKREGLLGVYWECLVPFLDQVRDIVNTIHITPTQPSFRPRVW